MEEDSNKIPNSVIKEKVLSYTRLRKIEKRAIENSSG